MQPTKEAPPPPKAIQRPPIEPLTLSHGVAQQVLGIKKTKYWQLVKSEAIRTVMIGGRSMAVYASLKQLVNAKNDA
jgi:hypothetical protein